MGFGVCASELNLLQKGSKVFRMRRQSSVDSRVSEAALAEARTTLDKKSASVENMLDLTETLHEQVRCHCW